MIVKDESAVIKRCLKSVKPWIDYWVIVDTGSTDGTQKIIQEFLGDLPGELQEHTWVNFGHNRNEALKLAKGKSDYVLFIDADEELQGNFDKNLLESDAYSVPVSLRQDPPFSFLRTLLINNHLDWSWKGVLHEGLNCIQSTSHTSMKDVVISAETRDGHRSQDPQKHLKDAETLEKALLDEPDNAEYVFFLGQSYFNAAKLSLALKNYKRRSEMPGWDQSTFWAKYFVGYLQELLEMDPKIFMQSYSEAFHFRPTRVEPLFRMALHHYSQENYIIAYALAKLGIEIPVPDDNIYREDWIYSYGMHAVFANSAKAIGKNQEAIIAYGKIAEVSEIPEEFRIQAITTKQILEEQLANSCKKILEY